MAGGGPILPLVHPNQRREGDGQQPRGAAGPSRGRLAIDDRPNAGRRQRPLLFFPFSFSFSFSFLSLFFLPSASSSSRFFFTAVVARPAGGRSAGHRRSAQCQPSPAATPLLPFLFLVLFSFSPLLLLPPASSSPRWWHGRPGKAGRSHYPRLRPGMPGSADGGHYSGLRPGVHGSRFGSRVKDCPAAHTPHFRPLPPPEWPSGEVHKAAEA